MTAIAPPVLRTALVACPIDHAFTVFTDEIGAWWPLPTHSVFRERAGGLHFVDGRLVERSTDGREATWAEVLEWDPPHRLVLTWHPGSGPEASGRVEVRFTEEDGGTRIDLRHDGWEAFGEDALRRRRNYAGPSAWGHVLDHFADGAEPRDDGADLAGLADAYDAFFAEAAAAGPGGFAPPDDGGWTAEQVVAHVALNDLAMTAVAHALVHRGEPAFENHTCQVRETLDAVVGGCGDLDGLVAFGRRCAAQALAAARRLDEGQRAHPVACRLEHDGEVVADAPMPWGLVAIETQATRHLPAHVEQLRKLRT
ncbi:MAG: SRPBCC domain-containing protein [Actinomycetota bacterium]|nr:SRPBCC domain-containing protein [Actinomycetota bacterium]